MRILTVTLIALAAFILGLAAADHVPREAAAQAAPRASAPAASQGFDWKSDGKTLTFVNRTTLIPYLAQIRFKKGAQAPSVPTRSAGELRVPQANVDQIYFYRLEGALFCDRLSCRFRRPCEPPATVADCPIPGPIPIGVRELMANLVPK